MISLFLCLHPGCFSFQQDYSLHRWRKPPDLQRAAAHCHNAVIVWLSPVDIGKIKQYPAESGCYCITTWFFPMTDLAKGQQNGSAQSEWTQSNRQKLEIYATAVVLISTVLTSEIKSRHCPSVFQAYPTICKPRVWTLYLVCHHCN